MRRFLLLVYQWHRDQRGLTLLELLVVTIILSLLATITGLAVSGQATVTRVSIKITDIAELQKAVNAFSGEDGAGRFPVNSTAGELWNLTGTGVRDGKISAAVKKALTGNLTDRGLPKSSDEYIEINFNATLHQGGKTFIPDFIPGNLPPKHTTKQSDGTFKSNQITPEGATIRADDNDTTIPVWLLDKVGTVTMIQPSTNY